MSPERKMNYPHQGIWSRVVYWLIDSEEASWKDSKLTTKSSSVIVRRLTDLSYVLEDITQRQKVNLTIDLTLVSQHYELTMKMRAETWW